MSAEKQLGRRHLLVLGAAASVATACGGTDSPLGGPYGGTAGNIPGPTPGSNGNSGGSSGGSSGSSSGGGSGGSSGGGSGGGSGSSSGGSSGGGSGSSSGSSSGGGSGGSSGSSSGGGSGGSSGSSSGGTSTCTTSGSNIYAVTFAQNPGLNTVGQGVTVSPPNYSDNWGNNTIWVVQESAGKFIAFSLSCTHQGCVVNASGSGFRCPCHSATFSATGASTSGRAPSPLQSYSVCNDSNGVYITLA